MQRSDIHAVLHATPVEPSRRVLICGDRHWTDRGRIDAVVRALDLDDPHTQIIVGDAKGADQLAYNAAVSRGMNVRRFVAEWDRYGRAAGPKRNSAMLDTKPDLVIAFHPNLTVSRGTADTVRKAQRLGIPVQIISS